MGAVFITSRKKIKEVTNGVDAEFLKK